MADLADLEARERLCALAERWMIAGWREGDTQALIALHAPDFVDYGAPPGRAPTREGLADGVRALFQAFPDFAVSSDDMVVDVSTSKVTIRWSAQGTHKGEFMGYTPTGRRITFKGIEIITLRDGLIIERWGEWDGEDLQRQLASG
jgi:steroid delta-isomerase-like uncharacterized protein